MEKNLKSFFIFLIGVALALIIYLGTLIAANIKNFSLIGKSAAESRSITISGEGKVTATPNIAVTDVGLVTEKNDVASAQLENSQKINALIAAMQQLGISKDDIRTAQYQIYPKYSYDAKTGSTIMGYSVTQTVEVKIRDLTKISQVLASAGTAGANQVSGIQFTIDDPKNLKSQARDEAVADAQDKAQKLAALLGVHMGRVLAFSEDQTSPMPQPLAYARADAGGSANAAAPDIQAGSLDVMSQVNITYEIE